MSERADHISLMIDEQLACVSPTPSDHCIFGVYDEIRVENKKAYEPLKLAIGPYYYGKDKLKEMEEHKMRYLHQLFKKRNETSVDKYIMALGDVEERARKCYSESSVLNEYEFLKMMLLDGFFMIELFRRHENDPIFQSHWFRVDIRRDLLLLENQLPFFIVVKLFNMTTDPNTHEDIRYLALSFMEYVLPGPSLSKPSEIEVDDVKHLLHLVHNSMCASFGKVVSYGNENDEWEFISSVTQLQEAGIELKAAKECNSLYDIKFNDGLLEIPPFSIGDETESVFRNLIAYEQFLPDIHRRYVADYAKFMESLISSPSDTSLLRSCGIIKNFLGDDGVVCTMLNNLGNSAALSKNFTYTQVFNNVNKHCKRPYNRWMANLRRNYFNSPWAFISFVAAFVLLLLTVAQTIFSVLSYF
ncbi:unnamed protein product [Ilex paraguariensis]|uniref:Uncharacterized protein n=1 Tax=Ilex paraguariensis TaxID=185542 RepID=A0ABC8UXI0_9AQUA